MASENGNLGELDIEDGYSLESILAEYKGSAYIDGEKKTPPDVLDEQIKNIVREAGVGDAMQGQQPSGIDYSRQYGPAGAELPAKEYGSAGAALPVREYGSAGAALPVSGFSSAAARDPVREYLDAEAQFPVKEYGSAEAAIPVTAQPAPSSTYFDEHGMPAPAPEIQDAIVQDVQKAIERELGGEIAPDAPQYRDPYIHHEDDEEAEHIIIEDKVYEEPVLTQAARTFAMSCNSISLRCFPALMIAFIMLMMTFAYEGGLAIPFGIGRSQTAVASALMIAQLVIMILCVDIIIRGVRTLVHAAPNIETLVLFSCVFSLASAAFSMLEITPWELPYCAVSGLSLAFAALGERYGLRAMTDTLKTASSSSEPYGVQAEYVEEIEKSVLKKISHRTDGFYNRLMHPDITETAYKFFTPFLLVAALVLSVIAAIAGGRAEYFLHILSATLAAAAPFSAMLAFSIPFGIVARSIKKSGAAIAGWGGADDIYYTDGACVTDDDLFPPSALGFDGAKLYDNSATKKIISYTAGLLIASGSSIGAKFAEVLKSQGITPIEAGDFECSEGGVTALMHGERVIVGSAAFMNLYGIRIPEEVNLKNALFTAINGRLMAAFVIEYEPRFSVQAALISMLKWRIKLFFAVRDFNITPLMVEQKFKVSLEDFEYIQARDSYIVSDLSSGKAGRMAAVLSREGFGPFAEAVTGGRILRTAALASTVISILSAILGLLLVYSISWAGSFHAARPGNLILYMLSMLAVALVSCSYARFRK